MADESRYVARSALIAAQTGQYLGRGGLVARRDQRVGQVVEGRARGGEVAGGSQLIKRSAVGERREYRDGATPVCDLDRLASFDEAK